MDYDKQFFQTIFNQLDEEIWVLDRQPDGEFVITDTNLSAYRNSDLQTVEVIGTTIRALLGDAKADELYPIYDKCLQTGETAVFHEYIDFGNQRHWYLTRIVPLPAVEGRQRVADVAMDITHRMESDVLLQAINQAQLQFIQGVAPNQLFATLLDAVLALTRSEYGFIAQVLRDDDTASPYMRMFAVSDRAWNPDMYALYNQTVGGMKFTNMSTLFGAPVVSGKIVIANDAANDVRRGGIPKGHPEIRAFLGVPFIHDGDVLGLIGIANRPGGYDTALAEFLQPLVTTSVHLILGYQTHEQRQVAESNLRLLNDDLEHRVANRTTELEDANAQLRELNRQKSNLVAMVAHDLRQPIAILNMGLYLLKHAKSADQPAQFEKMTRQIDLLDELIENILDLSRFDLAQPVHFQPFELNEVVGHAVEAFRHLVANAGLTLVADLAPNLPPMVGVANQVTRAVTNLVANAVRFTPSGSVVVHTRFKTEAQRFQLQVSDTGIGIDPADLPRLFEPFYRGTQHGSKAHIRGNGLGLAIVKQIVDLHQGSIAVESTVGQGTTFMIEIPLLPMDTALTESAPSEG